VEVLGFNPIKQAGEVLQRIGFVAQDHPLYKDFTIHELCTFGRHLNPTWDDDMARHQLVLLGLALESKIGQLSGGQQAQVALVLALAKRPEVLLLDEPIAAFDPLARRDFLQLLMQTVAETGVTVLLSSHIIGDLERVCDSLLLLSSANVQLTGQIEDILAGHRWVVGPADEVGLASKFHSVIHASSTLRQVSLLVKLDCPLVLSDSWTVRAPSLEDIVLGYLHKGHAGKNQPELSKAVIA
jgi:ABC-2 type transport system ATP-binding protein